jgi:ATP-dependent DNA helicase RecQ
MTTMSWEQLVEGNPRLQRRIRRAGGRNADLLSLIRDALAASGADGVVIAGSPLDVVDSADLASHGLVRSGEVVRTSLWWPSWLEGGRLPVGAASSRREVRQSVRAVPADRFYSRFMGHADYRSAGQRLAVRCAASSGSGDVITCVLPTGSGKTDVFVLRALQLRPRQTLVIVPTVSLALDLERRVRGLLDTTEQFAYVGGLNDEAKASFRERVKSGEQWLTITSPEAACTALSVAFERSAETGRLGLIVIDEAHIVADWGDDFRLEFQTFAALRRRFLETAPPGRAPTTMLFTGTLDQRGYDTLRSLFPGGHEVLVADQSTRPEPEWWSAYCESEAIKRERLLEAVAHLPRPLLVYTSLHSSPRSTTVNAVAQWLSEAGYRAVRRVAGDASSAQRSAAVDGLRLASNDGDGDVDIVVATSAFGMGVDIDDVRAVVHVCVPESVNRLYQEVGRAGRDGRATTSLVLWTDADREVAAGLAEAMQISASLAWTRWERMRHGARRGHRLSIDLTTPHPGVVYPFSDANRYWNVQTLLGMQRAGMIDLHWAGAPDVEFEHDEDERARAFEVRSTTVEVEVLQGDLSQRTFEKRFHAARHAVISSGDASYASALEFLEMMVSGDHQECSNERLAMHYSFVDNEGGLVGVAVQCGGCPSCRRAGKSVRRPLDRPHSAGRVSSRPGNVEPLFGGRGIACIRRSGADEEFEASFMRRLAERRTLRVVGTPPLAKDESPFPESTIVWWETPREFSAARHDPTDVLTLVDADSIASDADLEVTLEKLVRTSRALVLTSADRLDPADGRFWLYERYSPIWTFELALGQI